VAINPGEQPVSVDLNDLNVSAVEPLFGPTDALRQNSTGWRLELPGVSGIAYKI